MNDVIRECLESKPELLKRYEHNEARYVLQLPENYVTISISQIAQPWVSFHVASPVTG